MPVEKKKFIIFSLDELVILVAWVLAVFGILLFKAYEYLAPSIAAFVVLNLAIGLWVHKATKIKEEHYRRYLVVQTLFLMAWCPLLAVILYLDLTQYLLHWSVVLLCFYALVGVRSFAILAAGKMRKNGVKGFAEP